MIAPQPMFPTARWHRGGGAPFHLSLYLTFRVRLELSHRTLRCIISYIMRNANSGKEKRVKTMPNERPNKYKKITLKMASLLFYVITWTDSPRTHLNKEGKSGSGYISSYFKPTLVTQFTTHFSSGKEGQQLPRRPVWLVNLPAGIGKEGLPGRKKRENAICLITSSAWLPCLSTTHSKGNSHLSYLIRIRPTN
jgi:hypothetical protein